MHPYEVFLHSSLQWGEPVDVLLDVHSDYASLWLQIPRWLQFESIQGGEGQGQGQDQGQDQLQGQRQRQQEEQEEVLVL